MKSKADKARDVNGVDPAAFAGRPERAVVARLDIGKEWIPPASTRRNHGLKDQGPA